MKETFKSITDFDNLDKDNIQEQIGKRIAKCRKKKGIKQVELADILKKSLRTIQAYESGETDLSISTLEKLAAYFGVSVDYFFQCGDYENTSKLNNVITGNTICNVEVIRIANYIGCELEYLVPSEEQKEFIKNTDEYSRFSEGELILDIFSRTAINKTYRRLQVQLSRAVLFPLEKKCIFQKDLVSLNISEKKIADLYDRSKDPSTIEPFNFFDILRIAHSFKLSLTDLFRG